MLSPSLQQVPAPRRSRIPTRMRLFCRPGLRWRHLFCLAVQPLLLGGSPTGAMAAAQPLPALIMGEEHTPPRPDDRADRHAARHTVQDLARALTRRDSATAILQNRCRQPITARLLDQHAPPTMEDDARRMMQAAPHTSLAIRHVLLACGAEIYSEAWNLYRPDRLTPRSRQLLQDGHTPFGRAVGEHNFQRMRLDSRLDGLPPGIVLENHAILRRRSDGAALAYLIERYTQASLKGSTAPPSLPTTPPHAPAPLH